MYTIKINENTVIQDSIDHVVIDPVLHEKINTCSTLTYSIPYDDIHYDEYTEFITRASVFNEKNEMVFNGRLFSHTDKFNGERELVFESDLSMLNDVQYPPFEHHGTVEEFLNSIITYYNSRVNDNQKILLGDVTVTDPNDYIYRFGESYDRCWNIIIDRLVNRLGGYLRIRYENGNRYLDYLDSLGTASNQYVEFGVNLLDLNNLIDASELGTVIIPLGARIKDENGNDTENRVDIKNVNDGKEYLVSPLADVYGKIEKVVVWDDVEVPINLKTKAERYMQEMVLANQTLILDVVDLHFTSEDIDSYKLGLMVHCESQPHGINLSLMLNERELHLNDPSADTITLGTEEKTMSSNSSEVNDSIIQMQELQTTYFGKVNAQQIKVNNLESNYAEIGQAVIDDLKAKQGSFEELLAMILTADVGIIDTLYADIIKSDSILTRTLGADLIQSILTASDVQTANNILANYITAKSLSADTGLIGKIYTNRIEIQSNDTSEASYWKGNTIVMKDDSGRVRMVIGKVNEFDYNTVIYDGQGNELFNATGVTLEGLNDGILAEKLNTEKDGTKIRVGRLDVGGMVNYINYGEPLEDEVGNDFTDESGAIFQAHHDDNVVRASGIYFDDGTGEGDPYLDVVMNKVYNNQERLETQFTDIHADLDGFKTTVGSTYVAKEGLMIGGNNYIPWTSDFSKWTYNGTMELIGNVAYFKGSGGTHNRPNGSLFLYNINIPWDMISGEDFVLSFEARSNVEKEFSTNVFRIQLLRQVQPLGELAHVDFYTEHFMKSCSKEWKRYNHVFKLTDYHEHESPLVDNFVAVQIYLNDNALSVNNELDNCEFWLRRLKLERGTIPTDWTPNEQDLRSEINTFVSSTNSAIQDLQDQIDDTISTWYYSGVPTNSNAPANQWTTNEIRNQHIGDLYYDKDSGHAYRYLLDGTTYKWVVIIDTQVQEALAKAQNAQDTADGKRTIKYSTVEPSGSFDVGDLWVNGTDIKVWGGSRWMSASDYQTSTQVDNSIKNKIDAYDANLQTDIDELVTKAKQEAENNAKSYFDGNITSYATLTQFNQTKDLLELLAVESSGEASGFRLTPSMISMIARDINLQGKVSFEDLSNRSSKTVINGDNIKTGSITSNNYSQNISGTKINLNDGTIDTKNFKLDSLGNVLLSGVINALGGSIGGFDINGGNLSYISNDFSVIINSSVGFIEFKSGYSNPQNILKGSDDMLLGTYKTDKRNSKKFVMVSGSGTHKVLDSPPESGLKGYVTFNGELFQDFNDSVVNPLFELQYGIKTVTFYYRADTNTTVYINFFDNYHSSPIRRPNTQNKITLSKTSSWKKVQVYIYADVGFNDYAILDSKEYGISINSEAQIDICGFEVVDGCYDRKFTSSSGTIIDISKYGIDIRKISKQEGYYSVESMTRIIPNKIMFVDQKWSSQYRDWNVSTSPLRYEGKGQATFLRSPSDGVSTHKRILFDKNGTALREESY